MGKRKKNHYFMGWIVMKTNLKPSIIAPAITASKRQKQKNAKAVVPRRPGEEAKYGSQVTVRNHKPKETERKKPRQWFHDTPNVIQLDENLIQEGRKRRVDQQIYHNMCNPSH